jgi:hypothetical protein
MSDASNNLALAALVTQNLRGQGKFSILLADIDAGTAHKDALHDAVRLILASGEAETLRSFLRQCQKQLERGA